MMRIIFDLARTISEKRHPHEHVNIIKMKLFIDKNWKLHTCEMYRLGRRLEGKYQGRLHGTDCYLHM